VKPGVEKITKEVSILIKKSKHIRRYKYTTDQNLEPIEDALEGLRTMCGSRTGGWSLPGVMSD
jgi:hypothetical protein